MYRDVRSLLKSLAVAGAVCSGLLWALATPSAQLGEVARKEAERRKTAKTGKTYTNENLQPAPQPSAGSVASDAATPGDATPADAAAAAPAPSTPRVSTDPEERKKQEAQWRDRIKGERDALERAKTFADALQTKINALDMDFVNRDDPVQRDAIFADREKAIAQLAQLKKEIADHTKAIAAIQDEARKAGAPAGWVR